MICVIQRVTQAAVAVDDQTIGEIAQGMVVLAAVHKTDTSEDIDWIARKLTTLRIFPGDGGNFDRDVTQIHGSILLVSNFTVAADARKGRRPSLDAAADPANGKLRFDELVAVLQALNVKTQIGQFGADMKVSLINDGPVTFLLDSRQR